MPSWRKGIYDVAPIELAAGQQVERGREHAYPRGGCDGMQGERGERYGSVEKAGREVKRQGEAQLNFTGGRTCDGMRERESDEQRRASRNKSCNGSRDSDVKESGARWNWTFDSNECAQGTDQAWERNEKGRCCVDLVMPSIEKVSHFVGEENEHQREGERKAEQQISWMVRNPANGKKRHAVVGQSKDWLLLRK